MGIGEYARHSRSGVSGIIDAAVIWPDGVRLVRIADHWFFVEECE